MNLQKTIAKNVKAIREARKLTLEAASAQTGVSRSMLAQIERGDANPTISMLWRIANGYRVSFTSLTEDRLSSPCLIRASDVEPLEEDDGRYINCPAFTFREDRPFETYRIMIEPGGFLAALPHMPGTEEYLTVFAGAAEVRVGSDVFMLQEGDSLRFSADTEHSYKNICEKTTLISMLIYYSR